MQDLMSLLFETNAFKICEENKPFWYTSGKIGPYFVNTHFLYGDSTQAQKFLDFIDNQLEYNEKVDIPKNLFNEVLNQYNSNNIFQTVVNNLKEFIEKNVDLANIDYVSGGERRDWYFSIIIAYLLKKPHITIYKDLSAVGSTYDFSETESLQSLSGKKILHVADLLNTASSYVRSWIPAIGMLGAKIVSSVVVVDRMQGGDKVLEKNSIQSLSLFKIDRDLFLKAKDLGIINDSQLEMLDLFTANPDECMRNFLLQHPEFLEASLNSSDSKISKRAHSCVEQNLYGIKLI